MRPDPRADVVPWVGVRWQGGGRMPRDSARDEWPDVPGWYADPWSATGTGERYFDGKRWGTTERPLGRHTAPGSGTKTRNRTHRQQRPAADGGVRRRWRSV